MFVAFLAASASLLPTATAIDESSWFSPNDYPIEAQKNRIQGSVKFDVEVDAQGKPTACRVTLSSGYQVLDEATCQVVQSKGRFTPATDQHGEAVSGHYSNTAVWQLHSWLSEPSYRAEILDFPSDPLHPVCRIESKGPEIEDLTCDELVKLAVSQRLGEKVRKYVILVSTAPNDEKPFSGDPAWGTRLSYEAVEKYYRGFPPIGCVKVATEGMSSPWDGCKGFPSDMSDAERQVAFHRRVEASRFVVSRDVQQAHASAGATAGPPGVTMGIHEQEPGHYQCAAAAGRYFNLEIPPLPPQKPVTFRFRLISENADPEWAEQAGVYFETPQGRKSLQIGRPNDDSKHIYVALLSDGSNHSAIVDQYPFGNQWIDLTLTLKSEGTVQVASRGNRTPLHLGAEFPTKTELHCHSGVFEIEVVRPR